MRRKREKEREEERKYMWERRREIVKQEKFLKATIQQMHRACYLAVNGASVEEYVEQSGVSELPQSRDAL